MQWRQQRFGHIELNARVADMAILQTIETRQRDGERLQR